VSVEALAQANDLSPRVRLQIGRRLVIPGSAVQEGRQEPPSLAEIVLAPPPDPQPMALAWPVTGPVASPFGPRGSSWHGGTDIKVERGTPIRASAPGMVITSDTEVGYGHVIKIWHAFDLMTVYAHNQENFAKVGDWVERGQVIGIVGRSGRATAPHLHFEVRLDGKKYNPLYWLPPPGTVEVATSQTSPTAVGP
jgi:murein DD-endopeptidase MepM/ murein hydrolase activator NlpD